MKKILLLTVFLLSCAALAMAQTPSKELFTAVMKNNAAQVETLLKAGADPNAAIEVVPGFKTSYLITAATNNNLEVVKTLIAHKAQVNAKDAFQVTALMTAAGKGNKSIVELLLANGADVKAKDDDGKDALATAKESGNAEVIALIQQKLK
ncbi:ankyrin repeat domain-containing protein [Hymenobacter sp. BT491]|uniref:ankyrin repeat domain-containing protein n=1 Tax=Hymenobacter sp. BT491 TaxID=2766779 RepID=UPI0016537ED3|nr:ankyrin repeat domain-containing protein [Hymenobacter sp. BT491]MBC6989509.1 ankyrin repeat domain-containing protein [Hymenobacter sp. BT491]